MAKLENISFIHPGAEWGERIWDFLLVHYFPHEPILRSSGAFKSDSWLLKWCKSLFYSIFVEKCLRERHSIIAIDRESQDIRGVKLGYIATIADHDSEAPHFLLEWVDYISCLLPNSLFKALMCEKLVGIELRYDPFLALEDLECHKIYMGETLCVAEQARGQGLGSELVRRSLEHSRENRCEFYLVSATGLYSQRIYHSLEFRVMKIVRYDEFKDRSGRTVINDAREHTHAQTMFKAIL